MSFQSYKKVIDAQRESEVRTKIQQTKEDHPTDFKPEITKEEFYGLPSKNSNTKRYIKITIIIAVFLLAALKNPSYSEAKNEINQMLMSRIIKNMQADAPNEDDSTSDQLSYNLGMLLAPAYIDHFVDTSISNYIFFSVYESRIFKDTERILISSGLIVFGIIIPL